MQIRRSIARLGGLTACMACLAAGVSHAAELRLLSQVDPSWVSDTNRNTWDVFGPPPSLDCALSGDGRYVAFTSAATHLVPGQADANNGPDVFLYDRVAGTTTLVSHSAGSATTAGNSPSSLKALSADGRYVAFNSSATNMVSDPTISGFDVNLFLFDRVGGTTTLLTPSTSHNGFGNVTISADGGYVAFDSLATDLVAGTSDSNHAYDVFLYDRSAGSTTLVSHSSAASNTAANANSSVEAVSAGGGWIVFASYATDLVAGMTLPAGASEIRNLFLYETATGNVTLVSHSTGSATEGGNGGSGPAAVAADGSYVAFQSSAGNLVAGDGNGVSDVFLYERTAGAVSAVSRSAAAPGATANASSQYPSLSADGRYVAFASGATDLIAGMVNHNLGAWDVFLFDRVAGTSVLTAGVRTAERETASRSGRRRRDLVSDQAENGAAQQEVQ